MARIILNYNPSTASLSAKQDNREIYTNLQTAMNRVKSEFYRLGDEGGVDYARLRNSAAFKKYLEVADILCDVDLYELRTSVQRLAFWINVYNSLVIHGIIKFGIVKSVQEVSAFFKNTYYRIGDYVYSADDIEHGVLRSNRRKHLLAFRQFGASDPRLGFKVPNHDPRIHFALVCGSKSCPPIGVYDERSIHEQLDIAARNFISSEVNFDPKAMTLTISKVFKWYRKDFGEQTDVIEFIARYFDSTTKRNFLNQHATRIKINYSSYDWDLNHISIGRASMPDVVAVSG